MNQPDSQIGRPYTDTLYYVCLSECYTVLKDCAEILFHVAMEVEATAEGPDAKEVNRVEYLMRGVAKRVPSAGPSGPYQVGELEEIRRHTALQAMDLKDSPLQSYLTT